ncbi:MAG TPA: hypothetical protein VJT71_19905 [Pyrinomonadaceae bacterium]|nr:hypothetical protein [Pyrinomonadaceae bacterium]
MRSLIIVCAAIGSAIAAAGFAAGQQPASLVASAKGEGKIKLGKEEFKLDGVVVKLFEDGNAELNLITDITVFITGTWSRPPQDDKSIDLKITGNVSSKNLSGGGKLLLTEDRKQIAGLKLEIFNKISRKNITAEFVAK